MGDTKSARDQYEAIKSAARIFQSPPGLYRIIRLNDPTCPFHLEVNRNNEDKGDEIFKIRITTMPPTQDEIQRCRDFILPKKIFTKFILEKEPNKKDSFIFHEIQ